MAYEYRATRRIEFGDTDMAGIVHFSHFFKMMEVVESAFYRSLGHSVLMKEHEPPLGLPRVHASCDFQKPLRFEDVVEIHLRVVEKRTRSISYEIRFARIEPGPREEVAVGKLTAVCVMKDQTGVLKAVPFPESLATKIELAPVEA